MGEIHPLQNGAALVQKFGDNEYGTRHMDPEKVLAHAGKIFGMTAGALLSSSGSDAGLMAVLKDCFALASANGKELGRNDFWKIHFLGKQRELVQVIAWLLEVHFADFFGEAVSVAEKLKERFGGLLDSKE